MKNKRGSENGREQIIDEKDSIVQKSQIDYERFEDEERETVSYGTLLQVLFTSYIPLRSNTG